MLNFDSTHKSIDGDLNKKKGKEWFKRILATGLIIANILTFTGCAKTVSCEIPEDHAHYYVSQEYDMGRYIVSDKSNVSGLEITEGYIYVNEQEAELLKFMNKNNLYSIEENIDSIKTIENNNKDYTEYRYKYIFMQPVPIVHSNGKFSHVTYQYIPIPKYSWTTDQTRNLTGETRTCHHMYYGYRIYQDDNGKYKMEKSELVDDITELPPEYKYVGKDFTEIVNLENKTILDYEDGTEDDKGDEEIQEMMDEYEIVDDVENTDSFEK